MADLVRREIVEATARGEEPALFGAKITGGGSGGDASEARKLNMTDVFMSRYLSDRLKICIRCVGCTIIHVGTWTGQLSHTAGTVCILGRADDAGQAAVDRVVSQYQDTTRYQPTVFTGSSSGSAAFGHLRIKRRQS